MPRSKYTTLLNLAFLSLCPMTLHAADTASPLKVASGRVERLSDFPSRHVPARNIDVWLPDGYPAAKPYAVLYMHDGQMLFDATQTWNKQEWRADEVAAELIASGRTRSFIIVGISNAGVARASEYFPQKPFESLTPAQQRKLYGIKFGGDQKLFSGPVYSDRYLKFLVEELKPHIDAHYAVSRARADTFIMGSSLGALISMYALAEYPDVFGGAACLSTHWPGTIGTEEDEAIPAAFLAYMRRHFPAPGRHRIYFDHGTATLDATYADRQRAADRLLRANGYTDADFQSRTFPGADTTSRPGAHACICRCSSCSRRLRQGVPIMFPASGNPRSQAQHPGPRHVTSAPRPPRRSRCQPRSDSTYCVANATQRSRHENRHVAVASRRSRAARGRRGCPARGREPVELRRAIRSRPGRTSSRSTRIRRPRPEIA